MQKEYLCGLGLGTILGGEFKEGLASLAARLDQDREHLLDVSFPSPETFRVNRAAERGICFDSSGKQVPRRSAPRNDNGVGGGHTPDDGWVLGESNNAEEADGWSASP